MDILSQRLRFGFEGRYIPVELLCWPTFHNIYVGIRYVGETVPKRGLLFQILAFK